MAFSLNRAQIIGNVTRDPEVRQTTTGKSVASFGVATNSSWLDQSGQRQEKAEFHNVVAWGKLAEICGQYLKKGRKIFVEGRMQTRDWQGEDGVKRYRTEIIAEQLIILDKKEEGSQSQYGSGMKSPVSNYMQNRPMAKPMAQPPVTENMSQAGQEMAEPPMPAEEEKEVTLDDLPF